MPSSERERGLVAYIEEGADRGLRYGKAEVVRVDRVGIPRFPCGGEWKEEIAFRGLRRDGHGRRLRWGRCYTKGNARAGVIA